MSRNGIGNHFIKENTDSLVIESIIDESNPLTENTPIITSSASEKGETQYSSGHTNQTSPSIDKDQKQNNTPLKQNEKHKSLKGGGKLLSGMILLIIGSIVFSIMANSGRNNLMLLVLLLIGIGLALSISGIVQMIQKTPGLTEESIQEQHNKSDVKKGKKNLITILAKFLLGILLLLLSPVFLNLTFFQGALFVNIYFKLFFYISSILAGITLIIWALYDSSI